MTSDDLCGPQLSDESLACSTSARFGHGLIDHTEHTRQRF